MISGISYIQMRTPLWDECREVYGRRLGLTELQNTTAVQNEKGEWVDGAAAESGDREAVLQVGDSFLVLREDEAAPVLLSPEGERTGQAYGSVGHWSFYVEGNHHAFAHLEGFLASNRFRATKDGPIVQPMDHAYMQRSLLEFVDPNGYPIQISEIVDPRLHNQERRREKQRIASLSAGSVLKGFDHMAMECPDIARGREIYGEMLGLSVIDHSESGTHEGYVFAAGMCDIELRARIDGGNVDGLGRGVVGSFGLWTDDVDALAGEIAHDAPPAERDLALGVPIRSITLDAGDGLPVEVAQRLR